MEIETLARIVWALGVGALALGLAAIPLAYRRAGPALWLAHGALALAMGAGAAAPAHAAIYADLLPWWRTGAGYVASLGVPPVVAGWAGRAAGRRWSRGSRWRVGAAGLGALVACGYLGWRVAAALLPEVMNAVQ
jgi:hypothetical protein